MEKSKIKRILSLDGGGIRGAVTLGFLEKIESEIRIKENNPDLRLCDYYDLIGGTSTGSIIAAALAIGKTATEIKELYLELGDEIFGKRYSWFINPIKRYKAEFDYRPFEMHLKQIFKDISIGSNQIKTGLCIVTKRADTLSTWPIINHPKGKFYNHNKRILLRQAIRASAAAPSYFKPQEIDVGFGEVGVFIDGGVSLSNNPALLLFLVATLNGFPYNWAIGEDNLSITSIGTGSYKKVYNKKKVVKNGLAGWGKMIPDLFMEDANYLNQTMLQYLSNSPTPWEIDSEISDLKSDLLTKTPALHYLRYNVMIEKQELKSLGFNLDEERIISLREMSHSQNKDLLYKIGSKASKKYIKSSHFK